MVIGLVATAVPFGAAFASTTSVTLLPSEGVAGTSVEVRATGLEPRSRIQVTWDGSSVGMPWAWVAKTGTFRVKFIVPNAAPGEHTVALASVAATSKTVAATAEAGVTLGERQFVIREIAAPQAPPASPAPTATPEPSATAAPTASPTAAPTASPTAAPTAAPTASPTAAPTAPPSATPSPTPSPASSGFVTRDGTSLRLNGQPYRFTGLNIYNANSRWTCWYDMQSGTTLDSSLADIGAGQEAFRAWFFQRLATTNGQRDWDAFDRTIAVAKARGQRIVATLTNQWGDCENSTGSPVYKGEAWYRDGYTAKDPAGTTSYREWVREILTRYRNEPTILAWQLMNEAEALTGPGGSCSSTAEASVEAWARDVAGLAKSVDPNHLLSLGTIGNGQCGTSSGQSFERLHAIPAIDMCEYHDYDDARAMPGDQWNGLKTRLGQCLAMGKPMFIGETGLMTSSAGSAAARAAAYDAKFSAQFAAGVVGILLWDWRTAEQGGTGITYEIGPTDPSLALFNRY